MEKVKDAPFSPLDCIGQLTMRNLDTTEYEGQAGGFIRTPACC